MSIMIEGYVGKKIYPNNNSTSNGDYKIYSFYPLGECRNNVNINNYGNITINGELPELYEEVLYTMEVEYVKKGKYENYTVKKIKKDNTKITEDVTEKFLKAILTEKQVKEVLKHYPNIIELVTTNKKIDVSVLYGIKEKTMKVIKRKIIENFQLMDLVNEYYEYGMTFTMVKNLYNAYPSIEVIKKKMEEDPYSCLCKINRVGFKTADNIIIKKYPNRIDSKMRADACIYYTLKESENSGNTYIKMVDLYRQFKELASESGKWFKEILEASDDIHFHKETERVSLKKSYLCEKEISNKINELLLHNKILKVDYTKFNEIDEIPLTEQQMNTLKNLCNYNISILAGVAGSGKSFSTKALIDMLDYLNLSYILMSPTGKAAKVLSQFTNRKTSTIHRGLGYTPDGFTYNQDNKLPYDVVIIDEFSMIDIFLLRDLLRAIDLENTKVLFIGDPAQIPSVGVGNIAYDMLQSNRIPTTLLTTVFRYGEGGLSYVATKTRQGESYLEDTKQINIFGKNKDYVFINTSQENTLDCVRTLYNKLYYKQNISSDDILVLSAYNKGEYGTVKINSMIQDLINPKSDDKNEVNYKRDNEIITLREGDKVIQTKNNYHAITTEEDDLGEQEETCVYNGDIGIITSIDKKIVYVEIDGKTIIYEKGDYEQLSLAYSLSYHKCQGSGCQYVIMITPKAHKFFLDRNLLYVAETRAKQMVYHVGTYDVVQSALRKSQNFSRNTWLQDFLKIK